MQKIISAHKSLSMHMIVCLGLLLAFYTTSTHANPTESIEQLHAARNAYIEHFRIYGAFKQEKARHIEQQLKKLVKVSAGEQQVRTLFELATIQRLTNQFETAIQNYQQAALAASSLKQREFMFDAWLGVARSYNSLRNHGLAAAAFEKMVSSAGLNPTAEQRYDIADYAAQIETGRGELKAAMLHAMDAIHLAQSASDMFYAQLDMGDVFQKFAESCDYRKLIDAKTYSEEDSWGACRRSVVGAKKHYRLAAQAAHESGWRFLSQQAESFISHLDMRMFLIHQKASFEKLNDTNVFNAQDVGSVVISADFSAGATGLAGSLPIAALINAVAPEAQATDPRSLYLRGLKEDIDGSPKRALGYFQRAVKMLNGERSSMFDPRQRGTVVESRPELIRDLGLRLLAYGKLDDAFIAFESIRAYGLGTLSNIYKQFPFHNGDHKRLAELIQLESQISATQSLLVETTIAGIESKRTAKRLELLHHAEQRRRALLISPDMQKLTNRISSIRYTLPTMDDLQKAVIKSNIPVILYWVTHTNITTVRYNSC